MKNIILTGLLSCIFLQVNAEIVVETEEINKNPVENAIVDESKEQKKSSPIEMAKSWLLFVDEAKYTEAYSEAAIYFQNSVTIEQWMQATTSIIKPLGKVLSREFSTDKYMNGLPGSPDGEYLVIQFNSSFENKESAVETLILLLEKDVWKTIGYFIS